MCDRSRNRLLCLFVCCAQVSEKGMKPLLINLQEYGLSEHFAKEAALHDGLFPARVSEQHRDLYRVICSGGELSARVAGRLARGADDPTCFPAVGDWVMIDRQDSDSGDAIIHHILPRRSVLVRQSAGKTPLARSSPPTSTRSSSACPSTKTSTSAVWNDTWQSLGTAWLFR